MEVSTVPMEDFKSIPPSPTGTVGLLRPSELGEGFLGESGGEVCTAICGMFPNTVSDRDSRVKDRGPKRGLDSVCLSRSELCLLALMARDGVTFSTRARDRFPRIEGTLDR